VIDEENMESFVRNMLGCQCPDSVFDYIEYSALSVLDNGIHLSDKVDIGHRLLIYVIDIEDHELISSKFVEIIGLGKNERDNKEFNRFRLVLVGDDPAELKNIFEDKFNNIEDKDDKVHLHFLDRDNYKQLSDENFQFKYDGGWKICRK
jgi:hypothetical protein